MPGLPPEACSLRLPGDSWQSGDDWPQTCIDACGDAIKARHREPPDGYKHFGKDPEGCNSDLVPIGEFLRRRQGLGRAVIGQYACQTHKENAVETERRFLCQNPRDQLQVIVDAS